MHVYYGSNCSAGIGRTGTFIALDHQLQQVEEQHEVNIYNCVEQLRQARPNMVQTLVSVHTVDKSPLLIGPFQLKLPKSAWMLKMSSARIIIFNLALYAKIMYELCVIDYADTYVLGQQLSLVHAKKYVDPVLC